MDTIFALSSAAGKAGVAVIRISGPRAHEAVRRMCGDVPACRVAALRVLRSSKGERIDQGLVLTFAADASFTGERSAEFQAHGSPAVIAAILAELAGMEGMRQAEAGEFTRRALENGRLDLAQVEGLADLIEAETEAQRQQANRVFSGEFGERVEGWRRSLIRAAALLEATIDFADEEVPVDVSGEVSELVGEVRAALLREIAGVGIAERIRSGFEVAIVGAPNVGKSTLLNCLAGRDAAITSEHAGTTRDVIEVHMDLGGLPVTLLDTAGLRETDDAVEIIGVGRARERACEADLRVFLVENGKSPEMTPAAADIVVTAKGDLHPDAGNGVSGVTGQGVEALVDNIRTVLSERSAKSGLATHMRHKQAMERGLASLNAATRILPKGEETADIAAEELRAAIRALDSLVGRIDVEMVLDEIFASFCLGK